MKTFFNVLKTTFLTVGSIIGAGFITGRELVSFFGNDGFLPFMVFSGVLFFFAFLLAFFLGAKYKEVKDINAALFANPGIVGGALVVSSFFSLSATLSALDALFPIFGLPLLSVFCLLLACFFLKRGVGFLEKISMALIPIVIITVIVATSVSGGLDCGSFYAGGAAIKTVKSFLYVFMNIFVNFPVITAAAYGKSKKVLAISAATVSVILFSIGLTVCAAVKYAGDGAQNAPMPIIAAYSTSGVYPLLAIALFCCLLTSAFTAFYPIYSVAEFHAGTYGVFIAAALCFSFSRLGVKNIVDYAYPLSGAFGGVYLIRGAAFYIKNRKGIKGRKGRIIFSRGKLCAQKEKVKTDL